MISRVGGKSKLKKQITNLMPEHKTYVEPFVGGGSVFFYKEPADVNVINDKDKDIYHIYSDMKAVGDKMIDKDFRPSREKFDRLKNQKTFSNKVDRLYRNLYLSINSFSSNRTSYVGEKEATVYKTGETGKKYKTTKWKDFLNDNHVKIFNSDFKAMIKKYDSPTTLFYLDPPYSESKGDYKEQGVTPQDVYDALKGIKGKFILSYDYSPLVHKTFHGYKKKLVRTKYETRGEGQAKDVKELLIMNY